jgi:hypothetical protein
MTDLIALSTEQAVLAVLQDGLPGQRAHLGQRLSKIFVFQEIVSRNLEGLVYCRNSSGHMKLLFSIKRTFFALSNQIRMLKVVLLNRRSICPKKDKILRAHDRLF